MQPIYLDHNATTPVLPEVAAAMAECQATGFANPESQHQLGRRARRMLEDAREGIAEMLGVDLHRRPADRLIFTSGGTEANNLAIFGLSGARSPSPLMGEGRGEGNAARSGAVPLRVVISSIEHPSVAQAAKALARRGWIVDVLPVSSDGVVCADHLDSLLAQRPRLISVMAANNETGVIQPVRELAARAAAASVPLHTDAVQAVGKIPVSFRDFGVAAMSIAAHKFNGPRGIGALVVRGGVPLDPILFGGFQEDGFRPGTQAVALAVGMHAALGCFHREQTERQARIAGLRDRLEAALLVSMALRSCSWHGRDATAEYDLHRLSGSRSAGVGHGT